METESETIKTKFQFSHRAKIGQNDHSNLLIIENTTVLSDIFRY